MISSYFFTVLLSYFSAITNYFLLHSSSSSSSSSYSPAGSLNNTSLSSLIKSHRSLIQQHLTQDTYTCAQPTPSQRLAWRTVVTSLLNLANDNSDCSSTRDAIPDALKGIYTITQVENGRFCALVEVAKRTTTTTTTTTTVLGEVEYQYGKGWGIFVVPSTSESQGWQSGHVHVHLSAPHPVFDLYTAEQATHVFGRTGAKSLFVPGRSRRAFDRETECVTTTTTTMLALSKTQYWKTDAVHDKGEMMFETYKAIVDWERDSSATGRTAYVQFHGKAKKTCTRDQVFLSAGLGRDNASLSWYTDPAHARFPIHLLSTRLQARFPFLNVTTPVSSASKPEPEPEPEPASLCSLTATKNIVGRLINGVPEDRVCVDSATAESATGLFVHIEQDVEFRRSESWDMWAEVFSEVFF